VTRSLEHFTLPIQVCKPQARRSLKGEAKRTSCKQIEPHTSTMSNGTRSIEDYRQTRLHQTDLQIIGNKDAKATQTPRDTVLDDLKG
jgi:hypothetical protein